MSARFAHIFFSYVKAALISVSKTTYHLNLRPMDTVEIGRPPLGFQNSELRLIRAVNHDAQPAAIFLAAKRPHSPVYQSIPPLSLQMLIVEFRLTSFCRHVWS